MPNWVDTSWEVMLPTKNVTRFLKYFLESDDVDKLKGRHLYRTFIEKHSVHTTKLDKTMSCLTFISYSAWSLESILQEHTPAEGGLCISLDWLCKDCGVTELRAVGDEGASCFRQFIEYDGDHCTLDRETLTSWSCDACCTYGYWEDYDPLIDHTVCPECGSELED